MAATAVAMLRLATDDAENQRLWQELPAVKRDRIYCISEAWLGRPGPRLVEGLRELSRVVEACADDAEAPS